MSFLRRLFSTGLIGLMCVATFSASTVSTAVAQQDDSPQEQQQDRPPVYELPQSSPAQPVQPQYSEPEPSGSSQPQYSPAQQQSELPDQSNPSDQSMEIPNQNTPNGPNGNTPEQNPPGRAARLQYLSGSVSIQPHGTDEWVQGSVNRPLTIADNVWADKNSRAELNVGTGLIRINSETSLTLTNVSDNSVQLSLHQGTMNLHVRHLFNGEIYEVDTPNQAFTILKTGDYRFDVDPGADTTAITVWHGEGESTGQGPSVRVKSGKAVTFSEGDSLAHYTADAPRPDSFDDWCQVRNRREDESVSARYVSPDVVGSEDLDAYGTWRQTPQYGAVWVPTEAPGWAPYSYGHWIWVSPWGWTWVDDAPWGYAPFHYGRWVSFGGYWGWAPGPYYGGWSRGWYAPALVSWYGGPGWGVGVGFGGIGFGYGGGFGWCALGFGEPFIPWYRTGWGYFRNVNIYNTRITNINIYHNGFRNGFANANGLQHVNMTARGGFTAVNRGTLERGLPVHQNSVRLTSNDVRSAPALGRVSANPTRSAMLGPSAGRPAAVAPSSALSRPVVSHMAPPAASRTAFNSGIRATAAPAMGAQANRPTGPARAQSATTARPNGTTSTQSGARPSAYSQRQYVPRPPQTFANNSAAANNSRMSNGSSNGSMPVARNVPRPQASTGTANGTRSSQPVQSAMNRAPANQSMARPQQGSVRQSSTSPYFGRSGSSAGPSAGPSAGQSAGPRNVPRPTGTVQPAPRNYQSSGNSSGYSSRSYGQSSGAYSSRGYSAPQSYGQSQRYSGSPYSSPYSGRSYSSSPYQGGRSYSAPSYSAPSYSGRSYAGGGGGYSAPSHGSSSYGGGGGSRGGSSGGGSRGSGGSGRSGGHR